MVPRKRFLFVFGYETPSEREYNMKFGSDLESSEIVFIEAEDAERALEWGKCIAEKFLCALYGSPGVSWRKLGYASYIDQSDPPDFDPASIASAPCVSVGELPDIANLVKGAHR